MAEMMYVKMFVTPEIAENYLKNNNHNRNINKIKLKYLENQLIKNKGFDLTHQGIAIAEDGELLDGQHRLKAIVNTGIGTYMMVCLNALRSANIDIGTKRSYRDTLIMAGIIEKDSKEARTLSSSLTSFIAQRNYGREFRMAMSSYELHEVYLKKKETIDAVVDACSNGGKACNARGAAVLYGACCAYEAGVSEETIKRWHNILTTMDYYVEGDEKATKVGRSVRLLSTFLNEKKQFIKADNQSSDFTDVIIKKTESSIRWYNAGKPIEKLYGEYCYPEIKV